MIIQVSKPRGDGSRTYRVLIKDRAAWGAAALNLPEGQTPTPLEYALLQQSARGAYLAKRGWQEQVKGGEEP